VIAKFQVFKGFLLTFQKAIKGLFWCFTFQKIKWSVSGAGGRRNENGAVSGQNVPLKISSTIKPLKAKSSQSI